MAARARCEDGGVGTTVLIVDDHRDFRAFARALLEAGGFEVVGEAIDGASALVAARALKPALVLLDVQLPDIDGFAVCEQLTGTRRHTAAGSVRAARAGSSRRPSCQGSGWRRSPARCRAHSEVAARRACAGRAGPGDRCRMGFVRGGRARHGDWRSCRRLDAIGLWAGGVGSSRAEPGRAALGRRLCTCIGGRSCTR